ncbi:MAG: S49 family peptidase [Pseudomonadota bacterium]
MTEPGGRPTSWERAILEKVALAAITEQRRTRRWGIFFKSLFFAYLVVLLALMYYPLTDDARKRAEAHTAAIDVVGMISDGAEADAKVIIKGLRDAVKNKATKGIILRMNTPGGSPVQASEVYDEIRRLKKERPMLPIYAVVSDICASGGYYIASAADKIFVSRASIIGSIGVIMNGFGFVDSMQKLGIERRLLIAGEHKAILDPFSPVSEDEKVHVQSLLNEIHQQFISAVRDGRGDRLKDDPRIFSGLVWTGIDGIKLGLADALGNEDYVAGEVIGAKEIVNFTPQEKFLERLAGKIGASAGRLFWNVAQSMAGRIE